MPRTTDPEDPAARAEKLKILLAIYFAQRGIARPADERLSAHGFGRAHHRVLAFIGLKPGLSVQELTRALRVANQNLNRVLSPLVKQGYVEQRHDPGDLRVRRLYLTPQGEALEREGFEAQFARLDEVVGQVDPKVVEDFLTFAECLMDEEDRAFLRGM